MSLADLALDVGRRDSEGSDEIADIISFVEEPWGLRTRLFPVQKVILKAHYGLPLDDTVKFPVAKTWRMEDFYHFTEKEYLEHLYEQGRCNIREVDPKGRRRMVLSIGRRSGKTFLSACIAAYETYKLITKGHPQKYYGLPNSEVIQLVSVAVDKDQAKILYRNVYGHFRTCDFFASYVANATQTFATLQTPRDIERFGPYSKNPKTQPSILVTFKSCKAAGLRGPGNIMVILDEMAHFLDKGQSSAKEVYEAITPSTSTFSPKDPNDNRIPIGPVEGRVVCISTPLGRQGQFYKLFDTGMRGAASFLCVQAPTWEVNPSIPVDEYEGNYLTDPRVFWTEYGAEFTDRTMGWIEDAKDLIACIDPMARPKMKAPPQTTHFIGIDVALAGDYTAVAIGHNDPQANVVVDLMERIRAGEGDFAHLDRLEFDGVADWIYDLSRRFYITKGMFDQHLGLPLEQALAKRGLKQMEAVAHTRSLNSQLFMNFKNMMFDRRLVLYDWPLPDIEDGHCDYIQELLELQQEVLSKYIIKVHAPQVAGKFDDYSDALVRLVWLATNHVSKVISFGGARSRRHAGPQPVTPAALSKARLKARRGGSHPSRQPLRRGNGRKIRGW